MSTTPQKYKACTYNQYMYMFIYTSKYVYTNPVKTGVFNVTIIP